ncbi:MULTISPECIES: transporter [unclassified Paludibacterium]|uniref:transporter n=1 Tax=unclassified Paludibacterium TaxID=2618429 RepID=UPI001C04DA0F|nr:transporter [Paludibacterium sp. B53371]BEV72660.1 transporter [Paludibacterium sp. THUN1379]
MANLIAPSQYGSDEAGLITAYRFRPGTPGEPLDASEAQACLAAREEGVFVWLHFNLANAAAERWLRQHLPLPDEFYEARHAGSRSTRIEQLGPDLLAVVNDVTFSADLLSSDISTLWAYASQRVLVTARLKPLRSVDMLRIAVRQGTVFPSTVSLMVHLLQDQADVLVGMVRETTTRVDVIEDNLLAQRLSHHRSDLAAMRRVLVRFRRLLAPEPGVLLRLLNRPPVWLTEADVQALRTSTEEFSLVLSDLDGLVERIKLLQEELATRLDEQTNRTLFTLTVVTVLALPINIVAGFFGMNVGGVPLSSHPHGFWILVLLVASFTGLAGWWAFRGRDRY